MATYSTVVTLDNLNTVYKDLRDRIGKIGNVYHVKGSKYWSDILSIKANSGDDKSKYIVAGDVFNLILSGNTDTSKTPYDYSGDDERFKNGANVYCKTAFTSPISEAKWNDYWEVLDAGLEEATDEAVGLIKTGSQIKSESDISTGNIVAGLKKREGGGKTTDSTGSHDHQTYVEIPVATTSTYGVVTNQAQEIGGDKTLNGALSVAGQLTVAGQLNLKGNDPVVTNSIQASKIVLDGVTISASSGVITFA